MLPTDQPPDRQFVAVIADIVTRMLKERSSHDTANQERLSVSKRDAAV